MLNRILTATYTDRVETLSFDSESKSLSITSSVTVGHHPSWITPHPENPAIWFTALEQGDGRVVTIEYDEEGKGKVVGELSSEGAGPCSLVAYKGDLLIANVSSFLLLEFVTLPGIHHSDRCLRGSTRCAVVLGRNRRCAPLNVFAAACRIVHDEAFA